MVLSEIGLIATEVQGTAKDLAGDAVLRIGNRRLLVEVKRDVRDLDAQRLAERLPEHSLVVVDRLSPRAKVHFEQQRIGWLDRRGHLRLILPPGIFVDRDINPLTENRRGHSTNPFTTVGLDVAIALLLDPTVPLGVREISRRTGASVGRVSELVRELRRLGLVNRDGTPATPDLFESVADAWAPQWIPLGQIPPPDLAHRLGGMYAAVRHGVSMVLSTGSPKEFYVRDEFALRRLVRSYPPSLESTFSPLAKAAVCPSPYGFDESHGEALGFPVVNHVIAALDLALDKGRGREALEQWRPNEVVRVW